jgi:hypothetical protein
LPVSRLVKILRTKTVNEQGNGKGDQLPMSRAPK